MVMYAMTDTQYQAVYNVLSFALASMMATTVYLWFRSFAVKDQYRSAVLISGLVTFIAAYHYISAVVTPYLFSLFPPLPLRIEKPPGSLQNRLRGTREDHPKTRNVPGIQTVAFSSNFGFCGPRS